jgi:uncharacterized protein YecE (DUF72 family)
MGRLYPKGTKDTLLMDQYIAQYRCLEFNGTHYRIYTPQEVRRWSGKATGKDFQFLPKFPQSITHQSRFLNVEAETAAFLEGVEAFRPNLGPLFLQLSEYYGPAPANQRNLYRYLATLPNDFEYFLELRHPGWFSGPVLREWTTALRDMGIGAVITDTPGRRDVVHMRLTTPRVFVRFVGKARHPSTYQRVEDWATRMKGWLNAGLKQAEFIAHCGHSAPEMSQYITERFNNVCGLQLPMPHLAARLFDPVQDAREQGVIS